jgi:molecular chaperone DnaK (HSP70)
MISILFAAAPAMPDAITWAGFTACVAFLMWMVKMFLDIKDRATGRATTIAPSPLLVKEDHAAVSQKEFERYREQERKEDNESRTALVKQFEELRKERSVSIAHLHDHIRLMGKSVKEELGSQLKEYSERTSEALKETNHRVIEHGERIAALDAKINTVATTQRLAK